ncbi:MAG: phosphoribosylaminoimidazolesuccinocarboxamide synthase [Bacteroidota bacterium]
MSIDRNIPVVTSTSFTGLTYLHSGKVRDIYEVDGKLLIVATDRLSAYDVIMKEGIPFKGKVLTLISEHWFARMTDIVPNHLLSTIVYDFPAACKPHWRAMEDRTMFVRKTKPLPVECVVRGYLSGSGWQEYQATGRICGITLPKGLLESDRLPEPIFTPATKEIQGRHDENISFDRVVESVGAAVAEQIRTYAIAIYHRAAREAEEKGIIIADTKMEFGLDDDGRVILIDELLTPDSSRFWPKDRYQPGRGQDSFDKQFVRDYLNSIHFNRQPPPPRLPEEIIFRTAGLYLEALKRLTGRSLP